VAAEGFAAGHGGLPQFWEIVDVPDPRPDRRGRTAGARVALVGQDDVDAGLRGLYGGPRTSRTAADHQYVSRKLLYGSVVRHDTPFITP
jgi:hypothetical protein